MLLISFSNNKFLYLLNYSNNSTSFKFSQNSAALTLFNSKNSHKYFCISLFLHFYLTLFLQFSCFLNLTVSIRNYFATKHHKWFHQIFLLNFFSFIGIWVHRKFLCVFNHESRCYKWISHSMININANINDEY
jgi:hypothetical protein